MTDSIFRFNCLVAALGLALLSLLMVYVPANASTHVEGHTDGKSIRVKTESRATAKSNTVVKRMPSRSSGQASEISTRVRRDSVSRLTNRGSQSSSNVPTRSTVCFRGDGDILTRMHGTYRCNLPEPETPAVPAADVATPPQVGTPVITEPVEIIITTSDLLELIPSTPQILMDRGPFGLKNAHTNFYASDNQAQTITRSMFGQDVTIVATPIEYRWDYGDGNSLVTQTPGDPVEIFNTETETSHQYTEPGLYTVTLTTVFEGTYQVDGGPTQAVSAPVMQQADPVEIRIWRAVTRNVDQTCTQDPSAWGCELTADPR